MAKAQVTWVGPGMRMLAEANDSPAIVLDSVQPPNGTHSGPTPMELILMGLAGCTAMDVISILTKKRQPLTGLQILVQAEKAETYPQVYTKIHLEYVAYGQGVDPEAVKRAIELSEEKYCSVNAMLRHSVEITNSYRVVEDKSAAVLPGDPAGD